MDSCVAEVNGVLGVDEEGTAIVFAEVHDGQHGFAHPMAVWKLLAVFVALIILTYLTVLQSTMNLGNLELWLSLFIATIKAALVILFFMHMINEKPLNIILFMSSFIFVALFLGVVLTDAHGYKDLVEIQPPPPEQVVAAPAK